MKLSAVISLTLLTVVTARDSCEDYDDYLCGDVCISVIAKCHCGNVTLQGWRADLLSYCCIPPGDDRQQCSQDEDGAGHCPAGQKLGISKPCYGHCFNEYQNYNNSRLGERSQYRCDDRQCVYVQNMCSRGYAACRDKSDLKECTDNLQCFHTGYNYTKPTLQSPHNHTECQYKSRENNGEYNNIGRGDEKTLTTLVQSSPVNYTELQYCTSEGDGQPGVMCGAGKKCKLNYGWCRDDWLSSCTTHTTHFTTVDASLCSNTTFWSNVSCTLYYTDTGEVAFYGKRCSANKQHCYYPWYTMNTPDFEFQKKNILLPTCQDKSDRIFAMNTKCNITGYVDEYCDTICNETNKHRTCQKNICENRTEWISKQTDYDFILDPHNCSSSCQNPTRGCDACTNTEDYFNCTKSGVCIHKDLRCDGHEHCQHGEDEDYDTCLPTYTERKVIPEYGTKRCPHRMYPSISTVAVVCDGVLECADETDEPYICENSNIITYCTIGVLIGIIILWDIITKKFTSQHSDQTLEMKNNSQLTDELSYRDFHQSESFRIEFNIMLAELKYSKNSAKRKEVCKEILKFEQICHNNNENKITRCLHQHLEPKLFGMIMDIFKPGLIERKAPKLRKIIDKLEEMEVYIKLINMIALIFTMVEISKDFILAGTIVTMTGGLTAFFYFPTKFTSTIVLCLFATIFLPLIFSTLGLAMDDPEVILKPYKISNKFNRFTIQAFVFIFSILNPILMVNSKNENDRKLREESGENLLARLQDGARIKTQYVKYLKTELGLETFYQLPLQLILLLVARTLTKTNGGLEAVFSKAEYLGMSADTILGISIVWSFKTCVMLHRKQIKTDKEFLPITSQVFVFLWGLFASAKRVIAILSLFIPSLGLFNILHHWQAEQIPFFMRQSKAEGWYGGLGYNDTLELNGLTGTVYWRDLDRTDWSDPQHPVFAPYTFYTGLTLGQTFVAFLVLLYFHLMAIMAVKIFTADNIMKAGKLELLRHCLENMNIPVPYEDFDVGGGEISDYRERRRKVNREMFWLMMVNFVVNTLMLTPLIFTGELSQLSRTL